MCSVRQIHQEPVQPDPYSTHRRHAVLHRAQVVFVDARGLEIARGLEPGQVLEARALIDRIVELAESICHFLAIDEELESFSETRAPSSWFGQRRNLLRIIDDEGRLDQL